MSIDTMLSHADALWYGSQDIALIDKLIRVANENNDTIVKFHDQGLTNMAKVIRLARRIRNR